MRHFIRVLLLLLVLIIDVAAYSQTIPANSSSSRENSDSIEILTHDSIKEADCVNIVYSIGDTTSQSQNFTPHDKEETPNWGKRSYHATLADVIATVLGIVAAIITLIWMHFNSKKESEQVKQQLLLLEQGNNQAKLQIQNQERALKDSTEKSRRLNAALKGNVENINKYLTQSDLKVKLTEKKDTVNSTFNSLWNSVLHRGGSKLKDGTIINNPAVLDGIITMETGINTFIDLLPVASEKCKAAGKICLDDIDYISKKKKKGEDIAQWLQDMKTHFDDLYNEMSICINNIK